MTKKKFQELEQRVSNLEKHKPTLERYIKELLDAKRRLDLCPEDFYYFNGDNEYLVLEEMARAAVTIYFANKK